MVCTPAVAAYIIVPPQLLPVGIGTALVAVGTAVLMVPLLVIVDKVPDRVYAFVKSSVPPAVVIRVSLTIKAPLAVLVPLVLLKVKLLYVRPATVWPPVVFV